MKKLITTITVLILTMILILGGTIGCQKEEGNEILGNNYVNELYDYTFKIPETWKENMDKIRIFEGDYGRTVTFTYPFTCDQLDRGGRLMYQDFFTIYVMSKEEYEEELNNPPVVSNLITESDGQVYVIYTSLDNIILEEDTQDEYNELHLSLEEIIERFSLNE